LQLRVRIVHHRLDQDAVFDRLDLDPAAVEVDLRAVALFKEQSNFEAEMFGVSSR